MAISPTPNLWTRAFGSSRILQDARCILKIPGLVPSVLGYGLMVNKSSMFESQPIRVHQLAR